jgi:hypothetical protein
LKDWSEAKLTHALPTTSTLSLSRQSDLAFAMAQRRQLVTYLPPGFSRR